MTSQHDSGVSPENFRMPRPRGGVRDSGLGGRPGRSGNPRPLSGVGDDDPPGVILPRRPVAAVNGGAEDAPGVVAAAVMSAFGGQEHCLDVGLGGGVAEAEVASPT
jgi:hypothetical protein